MKVKIGDLVRTDLGDGKIVAMTTQWCIINVGRGVCGQEIAVNWADNYIEVIAERPDKIECGIQEKDLVTEDTH